MSGENETSRRLIDGDEAAQRCMACAAPLSAGDEVYSDLDGGIIHAGCCGPERESYHGEDGQPLKDGEPIPAPWIWTTFPGSTTAATRPRN